MFLFAACGTANYVQEAPITENIHLEPAAWPAEITTDLLEYGNYMVVGTEVITLPQPDGGYLSQRGQAYGAQKVLVLREDSVSGSRTVNRYCWGCLLLDVALVTTNSLIAGTVTGVPNVDYGYEAEVPFKNFTYEVVYLVHPDSVRLGDHIKTVEFYDEHDENLLATATFNWNEQLLAIEGNRQVAHQWLFAQPLGFLRQQGREWKSKYSTNSQTYYRYNSIYDYNYIIRPSGDEGYTVRMRKGQDNIELHTLFYGQHDWTVGSTDKKNPFQISYELDVLGRVVLMSVNDHTGTKPLRYNVRIYYREATEPLPEELRLYNYKLPAGK